MIGIFSRYIMEDKKIAFLDEKDISQMDFFETAFYIHLLNELENEYEENVNE